MMIRQGVSAHTLGIDVLSILEFARKVRLTCDWCGQTVEQEWTDPVLFPATWIRIPMQEGWVGFYDACGIECERALNELVTHKVIVSDSFADLDEEETQKTIRPSTFDRWMDAWESRWNRKPKS